MTPKRFLALAATAAVIGAGCYPRWIHVSKDLSFAVKSPASWWRDWISGALLVLEIPGEGHDGVLRIDEPVGQRDKAGWLRDIEEYAKRTKAAGDKAYKSGEIEEIVVGGQKAWRHTVTYTETSPFIVHIPKPPPEPFTQTSIHVIGPKGKAYEIEFYGPSALHDKHLPEFEKVLASLKFL